MRIKHWQGYGCINAKVVGRELNARTGAEVIKIEVSGNHEWGLTWHWKDTYRVGEWLGKVGKFTSDQVVDYESEECPINKIGEGYVDRAIYTIYLKGWEV